MPDSYLQFYIFRFNGILKIFDIKDKRYYNINEINLM